ncbi:serine/threonine-protein kinase [Amycolatopsis taiwanensis]|uniref:serine/threonine-protein kinase n=1 Tax=Amycolatopsis taiwanensis TaxID=342230 RepID=UPI0004B09DE0|nr:protein kinase [Amycolatopsis taiwanensis]
MELAGFTEIKPLGEGGFGRVVLARHDASGTPVAIKYLFQQHLADPARLAEFRREAQVLQRVASAHISRLYEFVETPEGAAIVMEAVRGISLREVLRVDGRLAPESALAVLKGSLLGLADAHRVGIVHRDYKPDNVLVGPDRESKLVDFGIAVLAGEAGTPVGTPAFMAPEQWQGGPATAATDVYAATCVFFLSVTGARPYGGDVPTLRECHEHAPVPVEQVPEPVRALVARGMAKNPAGRPPGAAEFVDELEAAAVHAYGDDWEDRGLRTLAQRASVLLALTPLALLGAGTALAPGISAGLGASVGTGASVGASVGTGASAGASVGTGASVGASVGTGASVGASVSTGASVGASVGTGVAVGTGTVGAGASVATGATVGATLGAKVATIIVAAIVAAGVIAVVVTNSGPDDPPPFAAPTTTPRTNAPASPMAVNIGTRTQSSASPGFDVNAQYAYVSGLSDPAVQQRVNAALMAPLDDWISYVRDGVTGPEPGGGIPVVHNEVRIDRQDAKVLSVRYLLTVDSVQFGNHGAATIKTVNVDLAKGIEATAGDVFALRDQSAMTRLEQRILAHAPDGYCDGSPPIDAQRSLEPDDLQPYTPGGSPVLQIEFTADGVEFGIVASALGYPMACDYREFTVPYREVSDLMTPEGRELLPG